MTYFDDELDEFEEFEKNRHQQLMRDKQEIRQHTKKLTDLLNKNRASDSLENQAELLGALLDSYLHQTMSFTHCSGVLKQHHIEMILRIQKQCADTAKAAASIDYMKSLTGHVPIKEINTPTPLPVYEERTSETE